MRDRHQIAEVQPSEGWDRSPPGDRYPQLSHETEEAFRLGSKPCRPHPLRQHRGQLTSSTFVRCLWLCCALLACVRIGEAANPGPSRADLYRLRIPGRKPKPKAACLVDPWAFQHHDEPSSTTSPVGEATACSAQQLPLITFDPNDTSWLEGVCHYETHVLNDMISKMRGYKIVPSISTRCGTEPIWKEQSWDGTHLLGPSISTRCGMRDRHQIAEVQPSAI